MSAATTTTASITLNFCLIGLFSGDNSNLTNVERAWEEWMGRWNVNKKKTVNIYQHTVLYINF